MVLRKRVQIKTNVQITNTIGGEVIDEYPIVTVLDDLQGSAFDR